MSKTEQRKVKFMLKSRLNGIWNLQMVGRDAELIADGGIDAKIPGSVYGALLEKELINHLSIING